LGQRWGKEGIDGSDLDKANGGKGSQGAKAMVDHKQDEAAEVKL
jgi:hypothetical protein